MSQISKKFIDKQTDARIFNTFSDFFRTTLNRGNSHLLLSEFFTRTEKIYIAKRLMIAYLLIKEIDYDTISKVLKVSTSTIGAVSQRLETEEQQLKKELKRFFARNESGKQSSEFFDALVLNFSKGPGAYQALQHHLAHETNS